MTRPSPHWHPLLVGFSGFWSTRLAQDVTPKALLYHLQLQTLVSVCVLSQSTTSDLIDAWTTHSFWTIFFTFLGLSGWIGCWQISSGVSFDSGTSDLKICNRCKGILFLKFLLSLFLWDAARFFVVNLLKEARAWKPGEQSSSPVSINVSGSCVKKTFVFHLNDIIQLELTRNRKESRTTQEK